MERTHGRGPLQVGAPLATTLATLLAAGIVAGTGCHHLPRTPTPSSAAAAATEAEPRIVRYDTRLEVDVATRAIRGETTIRLGEAAAAGTELRFPRHDLVVDRVTVAGEPVTARVDGPAL